MNDSLNSNVPEPRRVGVWAEGTHIEAKEFVIPKKSPDSSDDIPTIPDLDDLQDILEKEISVPPVPDKRDAETASALAEVGGGVGGAVEGVEAALRVLLAHAPPPEPDAADAVWSVDALLAQLSDDSREGSASQ